MRSCTRGSCFDPATDPFSMFVSALLCALSLETFSPMTIGLCIECLASSSFVMASCGHTYLALAKQSLRPIHHYSPSSQKQTRTPSPRAFWRRLQGGILLCRSSARRDRGADAPQHHLGASWLFPEGSLNWNGSSFPPEGGYKSQRAATSPGLTYDHFSGPCKRSRHPDPNKP